ncbi:MAG: TraR/DksA family transcriptional regulator [Gammaproteobacteria bacterium]|nr:TraR/DksA family transcriptional regulator [Gammaproteobacteria bacterium]
MADFDVAMFRSRLLEMQAELEELSSLAKDSTAAVVLDQSSVGRLSRMDAMQGQQMALEADRRRKQDLRLIKAALDRIAKDEFGYCVSCGEEIGIGRLDVNPIANRCINCSE